MDAHNQAAAEAVTNIGAGGRAGQLRHWENKGMVLPRFDPNTSFEESAHSLRHCVRASTNEALDMGPWGNGGDWGTAPTGKG